MRENCSLINEAEDEEEESFEIHLFLFRWKEIGGFVIFLLFILISGVSKLIFHKLHFLSSRIPESCLLIVVGILWALAVDYGGWECYFPEFTPEFFFHYLLPPIILEAAYSLYNKAFFYNIWTILLYAVVGTAFNFLVIGGLLIAIGYLDFMGELPPIPIHHHGQPTVFSLNYTLSPVEIFTFSSIISAVDPVAVLAIFSEVGVNDDLYYMVFGESLLNDGVAVVLYTMMNSFAGMTMSGEDIVVVDIVLGVTSFFTIAIGGLVVGILGGLITAVITKYTQEVRVVEPLAVLTMAYFSYMMAELFHWSGILSLVGCGLIQSHYAFKNISEKAEITIHYIVSMLSSTMDCIIFLYLGVALLDLRFSEKNFWYPGFIVWTLVLCLLVRFVGVYILTYFTNQFRMKKINLQEQFIMAYGGLRGGVGFSLVKMIKKEVIPVADMFVTTVLMVVMSTVWIQGATIKPLVDLLNVDKAKEEQKNLMEELNDQVFANLMPGIENIIGHTGKHYVRACLSDFDEKFLMKWFTRGDHLSDMAKLYETLALEEHKLNLYGGLEVARQTSHKQQDLEQGHINLGLEDETKSEMGKQLTPSVKFRITESVKSAFKDDERDLTEEEKQKKILHKALRNSSLKHMNKPNKNLIHDDDHDMKAHLEKRLIASQLISRRLSNFNTEEDEGSSISANTEWLTNVINSNSMRRSSSISNALPIPRGKGRIRTISDSSNASKRN